MRALVEALLGLEMELILLDDGLSTDLSLQKL